MNKIMALGLSFLMVLSTCIVVGCGTPKFEKRDYSQYEYGDIDYAADIQGIDTTLSEKKISELDVATFEKAIQEVCFAYYYKNPYVQYDLGRLSYDDGPDSFRRTTGQSPEDTDWDQQWYAQCAEYTYDVYWELCGYEYLAVATERSAKVTTDDKESKSLVASYLKMKWDRESVTQLLLYDARPGDIFYGAGKEVSGHLIMIVGDTDGDGKNECLHCWPLGGGSLNDKNNMAKGGDQKWDKEGIVYQTAEQLLIADEATSGMPYWGVFSNKNDSCWYLYRPYNQSDFGDYHLSTDSVTRLTYSGLEVSKTANVSIHQSILEGDDVVITEVITNNGKEDYKSLPVTEYVANGSVLKEADAACIVNGRTLQWTVDVPAGQSVTLTYTLTNKYGAGEYLTIPAGLVAGLQTRTFSLNVAQSSFTEEQLAAMTQIATSGKVPENIANKTGIAFAKAFYQKVLKKNITLTKDVQSLMDAFCVEEKALPSANAGYMLFALEDYSKYEWLHNMMVKDQIGGLYYSTGEYPGVENYRVNRILDIQEDYYMPGDIFVSIYGKNKRSVEDEDQVKVYIYLGNGKVLEQQKGEARVIDYELSIDKLLNDNFIITLRPNQVY